MVPIGLTIGIYGAIYLIVYNSIGMSAMIIGLARTSTLEQIASLEAQVRDLEAYGCKRIFKEQVSSIAEREQLEAALNTLREGDKLVCTKLDRLARSVQHLGQIIERINTAGGTLRQNALEPCKAVS